MHPRNTLYYYISLLEGGFYTVITIIEDKGSEKKSTEEGKSEEQFSQSSISGKPSPFIGSIGDLNIIRSKKKERIIRNKSWDNF